MPSKWNPDLTTQDEILDWLSTDAGFLEGACGQGIYDYQRALMGLPHRFIGVEKSRTVGFSWTVAAHGVIRAHFRRGYTRLLTSYSFEEATEKIRYAEAVYEALPRAFKRPIYARRRLGIEWGLKDEPSKRSRLLCVFMPRGKSRMDIVLDELAHMLRGPDIYTEAMAIVARGGQLYAGSTHWGRDNQFYRLRSHDGGIGKNWPWLVIPWWHCPALCTNVPEARRLAATMGPEERVRTFAVDSLIEIFDSMLLDDFLQEFECTVIDESTSFFPYRLLDFASYDPDRDGEEACEKLGSVEECASIAGAGFAGFDVGRRRNASELTVFEAGKERLEERYYETFREVEFAAQEAVLTRLMESAPRMRLWLDETQIGMQLGENLRRKFDDRVENVYFNEENKSEMAVAYRRALETKRLRIFNVRERKRQVHSIRRWMERGHEHFDCPPGKKHHADVFWSQALAVRGWWREVEGIGTGSGGEVVAGIRDPRMVGVGSGAELGIEARGSVREALAARASGEHREWAPPSESWAAEEEERLAAEEEGVVVRDKVAYD